jgi:hypothetical protein
MRTSPINPQFCKFSIKKSEILTFQLQKRVNLQVLVKGLFHTGKKFFSIGPSHRTKTESLSAPPVKQGRRSKIFLQQTSSGNLGVCLKREPASQQYLEKRIFPDGLPKCPAGGNLVEENRQLQGEQNEPSPLR